MIIHCQQQCLWRDGRQGGRREDEGETTYSVLEYLQGDQSSSHLKPLGTWKAGFVDE